MSRHSSLLLVTPNENVAGRSSQVVLVSKLLTVVQSCLSSQHSAKTKFRNKINWDHLGYGGTRIPNSGGHLRARVLFAKKSRGTKPWSCNTWRGQSDRCPSSQKVYFPVPYPNKAHACGSRVFTKLTEISAQMFFFYILAHF